jgi:hypothetical protein
MISLTNAGRGSGKTHGLIEWAKGAPNRFVIGTHGCTGDAMEEAGLERQFVHAMQAKKFFQGRRDYEVAIDNLEILLPGILHSEYGIHPERDVIITSCFPEANMGKTREVPLIPSDLLDYGIEFMKSLRSLKSPNFGEKK